MSDENEDRPKRLALIASKGTLDWAYPPFILASAAAAMGWEVSIFFTFYGLTLLLPELDAEVSPLGNPAMPMKLPFGPAKLQNMDLPIPTALQSFPGFNAAATAMMKKTFKNKGVATVGELREMCTDLDVEMVGCQMTMDVFGFKKEDFIPEAVIGGAATFLDFASKADVTLFV
ncbi:MAG: DsrE/DsrF/DrsH-like family protein [Anaerolineales bacterium]|nr:DsrE/DsrF/DrsH-like family protein [Anaerolineales bacterium]MCB9431560.1 DsrE/DsrF/DrsH-like family protein [Ardenticatenaceae bacterium]